MCVTSILKLSYSTYLPITFQLNEGCFRAGPPCLCLCTSIALAVLVPDLALHLPLLVPLPLLWLPGLLSAEYLQALPFQLDLNFSLLHVFVCFFREIMPSLMLPRINVTPNWGCCIWYYYYFLLFILLICANHCELSICQAIVVSFYFLVWPVKSHPLVIKFLKML